jgi:uroporphyrinogen-III synthase
MALEDRKKKVKSILVTLPKPENDKNPYAELAKKLNLKIDFRSFIHVEGVPAKDFRKEKINLADFTAVIFTSRNSADHFFRICEEMRFEVPVEMKYFCLSETIALYLQKYIQYRKRKIFFGKQTAADLAEVLKKHSAEKFLYPCSDVAAEETQKFLLDNGYDFTPRYYSVRYAATLATWPKCFMMLSLSSARQAYNRYTKTFLILSKIIPVLRLLGLPPIKRCLRPA